MEKQSLVCSNDIIYRAFSEKLYLSATKLQKLLYFLYGHYYGATKKRLFEESFHAWQYGPVVPEVYNRSKKLGEASIEHLLTNADGKSFMTYFDQDYSAEYSQVFDYVWEKYKNLSAAQLTFLTHSPGSPWDVTVKTKGPNSEIDDELIRKYFLGEDISIDQR